MLKVIKGLLKYKKKEIHWNEDSSDQIRGKAAYNCALNQISIFIEQYESGELSDEYTKMLTELGEKK